MSDSKISSLTELTSIATDDEFVIVDKSDTSMAVSGTTKKVKTSSIIDTDGTLSGNLDSKVASQKATKTYADTKIPSSYIDTDGTLAANSDTKIASQKAVRTYYPVGMISPYAGSSAPTGYLLCDGSSLLRASYLDLFSIIGITYGSVDGTHFTLPNLKGKVVVGVNASETEFDVLGETGGEKTHLLTSAESGLPVHTHPVNNGSSSWSIGGTVGSSSVRIPAGGNASNGDSNTLFANNNIASNASSAHNNLQPYIALNYIIKY